MDFVFVDAELANLVVVENENDVMWANEGLKRVSLEGRGIGDDDCIFGDGDCLSYCQ